MLSKSKIKYIRSLEQKKYRRQESAFIAEGHKTVGDLLSCGFKPLLIVHTEDWIPPTELPTSTEVITTSYDELRKASLLVHPQQVIAVFQLPHFEIPSVPLFEMSSQRNTHLTLCLDGIQDPGNLGTIIRTADWFGIKHIICSPDTADAFAPKVVQATMGSIARVSIHYTDLPDFLSHLPKDVPIYGTLLDGDNIYEKQLDNHGVIVMGNEGNGISEEVRRLITHRLFIPPYPADSKTAESLNVSIATAIVCSTFRSQNVKLS